MDNKPSILTSIGHKVIQFYYVFTNSSQSPFMSTTTHMHQFSLNSLLRKSAITAYKVGMICLYWMLRLAIFAQNTIYCDHFEAAYGIYANRPANIPHTLLLCLWTLQFSPTFHVRQIFVKMKLFRIELQWRREIPS